MMVFAQFMTLRSQNWAHNAADALVDGLSMGLRDDAPLDGHVNRQQSARSSIELVFESASVNRRADALEVSHDTGRMTSRWGAEA